MAGDQDEARAGVLAAWLDSRSGLGLASMRRFVPAEWADLARVRLDGVLAIMLDQRDREFALAPGEAHRLSDRALLGAAAPALGARPGLSPDECLDAVEAAHVLGARLEAARLHAVVELATRAGEDLLGRKGVTDPDELSKTARERWRASCKSLTSLEVETLTGMGRGRSREVVALALAPASVRVAVTQGLVAGVARWELVSRFWNRCRRLPHEQAGQVATALFATDAAPAEVAVERLDADGAVHTRPWHHKQFVEALEREAVRAEGTDPAAQAARRAASHAARTAYGVVDDDGTGQVVITGDAASVSACVDRLHVLAKKARAAGDERSEAQLRSDLARALLLHGTLTIPDLGEEPDLVTPDQIEALAQVLAGDPAYELQVIVPWDTLTGQPVNDAPHCCPAPSDPDKDAGPNRPGGPAGAAGDVDVARSPGSSEALGASRPPGRVEGVGRLLGRFTRFLTGTELRAMALAHGTVLSRILFDPADGRCLERTLDRYRPDEAMRALVRAADLTSRGPGSTVPAGHSQLDHVLEYLLHRETTTLSDGMAEAGGTAKVGGATTPRNLQALDIVWHAVKTAKFWRAVMDAETRDVTWTSFFGRIYTTRPHDYRQYLATGRPHAPDDPDQTHDVDSSDRSDVNDSSDVSTSSEGGSQKLERLDIEQQRHLASLLVYAALAGRQRGDRLEAYDDDPDSDDELVSDSWKAIWVRRTRPSDGKKVGGAHPGTPTPRQIITTRARTVLEAEHWTDPFTQPGARDAQGPGRANPGGTRPTWPDRRPDQTPPPF